MSKLKVRVTGPHYHGGQLVPEGEVIELPAKVARLMCSTYKTGELVEEKKTTKRKNREASD